MNGKDIVVISARPETSVVLGEILAQEDWNVRPVCSYREGCEMLAAGDASVVISDSGMPDGNWKDLLPQLALLAKAPKLIVTSPLADEALWAEVLNLGGYDVLAQPFVNAEVKWVVSAAAGQM